MTQEEEAWELMRCRRCGRFSGPEELCVDCDAAEMAQRDADRERLETELCGPYREYWEEVP